ncbi:unnamed protein product, partial [Allacma fusca]
MARGLLLENQRTLLETMLSNR